MTINDYFFSPISENPCGFLVLYVLTNLSLYKTINYDKNLYY